MRDWIKALIGGAVLIGILGTLVFVVYKGRMESQGREYEGTVVEKWADYTHSQEGSFPLYRLLVETDDGQKLRVPVDYELYQRVQTGSRIRKSKTGIEVSPGPSPLPRGGAGALLVLMRLKLQIPNSGSFQENS